LQFIFFPDLVLNPLTWFLLKMNSTRHLKRKNLLKFYMEVLLMIKI